MADWYINADTGDDGAGDGSSGSPWETISKAHTEAAGGDTIICQDSDTDFTLANQTFAKSLTIEGEQEDASGPQFVAGGSNRQWGVNDGVDLVLEKLTFKEFRIGNRDGFIDMVSGAMSGSITAEQCVFHDVDGEATENYNCAIFGIAVSGVAGVSIAVRRCTFYNLNGTAGDRLRLMGDYSAANTTFTFTNNTVVNGTDGNTLYQLFGFLGYTNNTYVIKNNIIYNVSGSTLAFGTNPGGAIVPNYNCFSDLSGVPAGTGNITSDPLLVDPDDLMFGLRPTSPCINTAELP